MRVLVTGGGGFLGKYVLRALQAAGHEGVAFQRRPHPELESTGTFVKSGSLLDGDSLRSALHGCEAVIHVAAKAGVWGPRSGYFRTNVEGTQALLDAMGQTGIRKLVYCSTASVVFDGGTFKGEDESLPYGKNWLCPYPHSKAVAEDRVLQWGRAGKGRVIALRPHLIWGIGDPHMLPVILDRSRSGKLRIVGEGNNCVDLTRVETVAAAHVLALEALDRDSAVNRPYFISQGDPVVLWEWINGMLKRLGIPPVRKQLSLRAAYATGGVMEVVWKVLRKNEIPPMTRFVALELARDHWFSIEAARKHLGFQPEAFSMEEGMEAFVADYLNSK